jgi:murein tripeptide amidase MpaA
MCVRAFMVTLRRLTALLVLAVAPAAVAAPPQTPFETSNGANWTTDVQEQAFLESVAAASPRVGLQRIGTTLQGRAVNLVSIGAAAPRGAAESRALPTVLFTCSQHGNEPAGREACLKAIRDLAFTEDPATKALLGQASILFVPAANPDGRAANTRGNSQGVDVNRDHIALTTKEARASSASTST